MISRFPLSILVLLGGCVWILVLMGNGIAIPRSFFGPVSFVIGALSLALICFDWWLWRLPGFIFFAKRPDLRGTWKGTLQSDWKKEDETVPPIDVFLIIYQTFTTIHLRLITTESQSSTLAASVKQEEDERFSIAVIYQNQPKLEIRERSPTHRGGMVLHVSGDSQNRLQGEYWTDRKTQGSLDLMLVSRLEARDFESAQKLETNKQISPDAKEDERV